MRSRIAKKLKGGKEAIKDVRKITKDKAGKASKALGEELPLYSDYAKQHKEDSLEADANRGCYWWTQWVNPMVTKEAKPSVAKNG